MNISTKQPPGKRVPGIPLPAYPAHTISVLALGMGLSLFLAISYVLCVLGYLFFPSLPIEHSALSIFLPGFTLLSWPSFFLGLAESFGWGWYVALVFAPLYNFIAARR
jgi:2TM family of unknown function (DUF5676)